MTPTTTSAHVDVATSTRSTRSLPSPSTGIARGRARPLRPRCRPPERAKSEGRRRGPRGHGTKKTITATNTTKTVKVMAILLRIHIKGKT